MSVDYRFMRLCTLSIFAFLLFFGTFWGVLGFNIPPLDAATPTGDLAAHFREHSTRLRVAYAVAIPACGFLMTWSVGIFVFMRRLEAPHDVLSYVQLMGGGLTSLVPAMACVFWLTAAFRPETDPAIIQMLYDMGWLTIDLVFSVTSLQYISMSIAFLRDKRAVPLMPSWVAWLGIFIGLESLLEIMMPNFRSGPFSWTGIFNYWIPFFGPFTLMVIVTIYMMKAIKRLEEEDKAAPA